MVFVLSMAVFGLSDLVTELIPDVSVGSVEIGIPYFGFVGLILVMLFNPLYAALGASFGELVFGDLLMGDFGGIGELDGFLVLFVGLWVAGLLVKDPSNRKMVAIAGMIGIGIDQFMSGALDVMKVWFGVAELEAIEGLPQSIVVLELIENGVEWLVAGILFGIIPALYMVPRMFGKIEPLMGIRPREPRDVTVGAAAGRLALVSVIVLGISAAFAMLSEMTDGTGEWKPDFVDRFGTSFIWLGIGIAAFVALVVFLLSRRNRTAGGARTPSRHA
ncbi:cell division protein FtsQ [Cohnella cholangitidis]|uniref:Cell division protein FtsQ n=2 Tax=Cohnella cholangitidis TaxID=2598458 RepID=A0A7G5C707_9BACL|nr:cell division protein FtsQ [Cohnella cholangitidis]